ncbi:MAG: hypothetical protein GTO63_15365, partial [Anaerolineae bacterium]|nr:hypothetical protein [Anaerolineae bacterium]NIN96458.1 hypothetical protein [Anaerolineae bacterium]
GATGVAVGATDVAVGCASVAVGVGVGTPVSVGIAVGTSPLTTTVDGPDWAISPAWS